MVFKSPFETTLVIKQTINQIDKTAFRTYTHTELISIKDRVIYKNRHFNSNPGQLASCNDV